MAAHSSAVLMGGAAFGAVLTAILIGVLVWLRNRMERYNTDNYSDEEDFPYNFAKVIAYAPLAWMAAMWAVFFSGDQWLIFAVDILATLGLVGFLCVILYPQKTALPLDDKGLRMDLSDADGIGLGSAEAVGCISNADGIGADLSDAVGINADLCGGLNGGPVRGSSVDGATDGMDVGGLDNPARQSGGSLESEQGNWGNVGADFGNMNSQEEYERVKKLVIDVVRRRFREPHLLKSDVLMEIGSGDICRASRFIVSVGYYNLVNMFRLEYARLYKAKHPRAKQDEIAVEAGFSSRTSYYKAKKRVGEVDYTIVSGVEL